jgi:hypothetical protein
MNDILTEIRGRKPETEETGDCDVDGFCSDDKPVEPEPEYLTGKQLATKLNVSLKSVFKWTAQRRIPGAVKFGYRWRYSAVEINKRILSGQLLLTDNKSR